MYILFTDSPKVQNVRNNRIRIRAKWKWLNEGNVWRFGIIEGSIELLDVILISYISYSYKYFTITIVKTQYVFRIGKKFGIFVILYVQSDFHFTQAECYKTLCFWHL